MNNDLAPWGFSRSASGAILVDDVAIAELTKEFGSPLYVISERTLRERVTRFTASLSPYRGPVRVCFSYKTNTLGYVLSTMHSLGVDAEVVNGFELWLAHAKHGLDGPRIVVGGPNKSADEYREITRIKPSVTVVDGIDDVRSLVAAAVAANVCVRALIRIRPGLVAKGMNPSTSTGGKKSQFGVDVDSEEFHACLAALRATSSVVLAGVHAHIGSGIHDVETFRQTCARLFDVYVKLGQEFPVDTIDVGGGLGVGTAREFTTFEMLAYLGMNSLPKLSPKDDAPLVVHYGEVLSTTLNELSASAGVAPPTLILEPGRALVSSAQLLLLTVGAVRERSGIGRCVFVDGGAMSTSPMFLSELHAVRLANRFADDDKTKSHVFGRVPSPLDSVYRNLSLPPVVHGDVLAVMDAGAYLSSTASNFGGPKPAVVAVANGAARVVQRRETHEDLVGRDIE